MNVTDPTWRLRNLYSCKDASTGQVIPYEPRPEQRFIYDAIYKRGLRRIVLLKARRLGISTAIDIMAADKALWEAGVQISIVDQTQGDASKKLGNICKVAIQELIEAGHGIRIERDNDSSLELSAAGDATSAIYAGTNARGGTNQLLHVSEWGPIQANDKKRSEEILTGALPSAEHGVIIIETTWVGGKTGDLWSIIERSTKTPANQKTRDDWHVFFFPWWADQTYRQADTPSPLDAEVERYLTDLEFQIKRKLDRAQRNWYQRKRAELGLFIFREFPSIYEECFRAPLDGAIVAWEVVQNCSRDYEIERVHLERDEVAAQFGEFSKSEEASRERRIEQFLRAAFSQTINRPARNRLGFDVAASGAGDLTSIYIDGVMGDALQLRALFTCRTEDWHFITTVLHFFLRNLSDCAGCGDETGLGRQVCWGASKAFPGQFTPVNFRGEKQKMGFSLMNQLTACEKMIPISHPDIGADYLAMRKIWTGARWAFVESANPLNDASHCDIAWSGALASRANEIGRGKYEIVLI